MKKRLLLGLLPALLILSSCNSFANFGAEANPKHVLEENTMVEDATAHEEIFGEAKIAGDLGIRKTANPESVKKPKVGVQWKKSNDLTKITVRYVAAISSLDVEVSWMRAVAKQDSNCPKKFYENDSYVFIESTIAYEAINNDGNVTLPSSLGDGYNYFVVYTLKDIPYDEYKYSYMAAVVTLLDSETHAPIIQSDIVAVNIDQQHYFSFSSGMEEGYFIEGTIGGEPNQIVRIDDDPDGTDHAKEAGLLLNANDNFGLFKWTHEDFTYYGRYNFGGNDTFYLEDSSVLSTNYSKVRASGTYTMFVNQYNQFNLEPESLDMTIYLDTSKRWYTGVNAEAFVIYYQDANTENWHWHRMNTVSVGTLYSYTLDVAAHPKFIMLRMDPSTGESGDGWPGCNNQTDDIVYRNSSSVLNNTIKIEYWHAGTDDGTSNSSYSRFAH